MIPKPIDQIGTADLQALVADAVAESKTIEYKQEMPGGTREEKIKFLAAVSSFANTAGGDLLIGVPAQDGVPTAFVRHCSSEHRRRKAAAGKPIGGLRRAAHSAH